MADIVDVASETEERFNKEAIDRARVPLAPGKPGECDLCGEFSGRLVLGVCAPCRDLYKLP